MEVLIVCKAITVWTQVIFTVFVSNRVFPYKALARLCGEHTKKVAHSRRPRAHSYAAKEHFLRPHAESPPLCSHHKHSEAAGNCMQERSGISATCVERLKAELEMAPDMEVQPQPSSYLSTVRLLSASRIQSRAEPGCFNETRRLPAGSIWTPWT